MGALSVFAIVMSCSLVNFTCELKSLGMWVIWLVAPESRIQTSWDKGQIVLNVLFSFMGRVYDIEDLVTSSIIILKWSSSSLKAFIEDIE